MHKNRQKDTQATTKKRRIKLKKELHFLGVFQTNTDANN